MAATQTGKAWQKSRRHCRKVGNSHAADLPAVARCVAAANPVLKIQITSRIESVVMLSFNFGVLPAGPAGTHCLCLSTANCSASTITNCAAAVGARQSWLDCQRMQLPTTFMQPATRHCPVVMVYTITCACCPAAAAGHAAHHSLPALLPCLLQRCFC